MLLVVWLGMRMVATRELSTGDMLLFIMYALMFRQPMVQLTRQGTRTGKILACLDRLNVLLETGKQVGEAPPLAPLQNAVTLSDIRVWAPKSIGRQRQLLIDRLEITPGSRVAVIGASGAGKSTFLELLAGRRTPSRGEVSWDGQPLARSALRDRETRIATLSQSISFPRQRLWQFLGLDDATMTPEMERILRRLNGTDLIARYPEGLATKLSSDLLSPGESRILSLARACVGRHDLLLLDEPCVGLSRAFSRRRLRKIAKLNRKTTIVAAYNKLPRTKVFDRVVKLHRGKIVFDGDLTAFVAWNAERRRAADVQAAHPPTDIPGAT